MLIFRKLFLNLNLTKVITITKNVSKSTWLFKQKIHFTNLPINNSINNINNADIICRFILLRKIFFFLLATALLLITSCERPQKHNNSEVNALSKDDNSDFYVSEIRQISSSFEKDHVPIWAIPNRKVYNLELCLKDKITKTAIQNQSFKINFGKDSYSPSPSDENGCIYWKEIISFNYFAPRSKYIIYERFIEGEGISKGKKKIRFAINPWASYRDKEVPEFLDLAKLKEHPPSISEDNAKKFVMGLGNDGKIKKASLWIDNPQIATREGKSIFSDKISEIKEKTGKDNIEIKAEFDEKPLGESSQNQEGSTEKREEKISRRVVGKEIEIRISFTPKVYLRNIYKKSKKVILPDGKYKIFAHLVAYDFNTKNEKGIVGLTPGMMPEFAWVRGGKVNIKFKTAITYLVNRGHLNLALKISPINGPVGLDDFEGLFYIDLASRKIVNKKSNLDMDLNDTNVNLYDEFDDDTVTEANADLEKSQYKFNQPSFNYSKYIKEAYSGNADWFHRIKFNQGLYFDPMELRFDHLDGELETATKRTLYYRAETCIKNSLTGEPISHQFFIIEKKSEGNYKKFESKDNEIGKSSLVATDEKGCLFWNDTITHAYYVSEQLVKRQFIIHKVDVPVCLAKKFVDWIYYDDMECEGKNFTEAKIDKFIKENTPTSGGNELIAWINPWDEGWSFGRDNRSIEPKLLKEKILKRKSPISKFFIPWFNNTAVRFRYEIDQFLNLKVKKLFIMKIEPKVLRYSSIVKGRNATEPLRDGVYLLKVALHKHYYASSTDGLVLKPNESNNNKDKRSVEYEFSDNLGDLDSALSESKYPKPHEYITAIKKLVRVQHGRIITPIELSMHDLRLMRIRSQILIQIETINEEMLAKRYQFLRSEDYKKKASYEKVIGEGEGEGEGEGKDVTGEQVDIGKIDIVPASDQEFDSGLSPLDKKSSDKEHFLNCKLSLEYREKFCDEKGSIFSDDLDNFSDPDGEKFGLPTRAFVGPVVLIMNYFSATLRATDLLNSEHNESDDGNQLTINDPTPYYDRDSAISKYYGSWAYLDDVLVSEIIERKKYVDNNYYTHNKEAALLYNYLRIYNLDFISLSDEQLKKYEIVEIDKKIADLPDDFRNIKNENGEYNDDCIIVINENNKGDKKEFIKKCLKPIPEEEERLISVKSDDFKSYVNNPRDHIEDDYYDYKNNFTYIDNDSLQEFILHGKYLKRIKPQEFQKIINLLCNYWIGKKLFSFIEKRYDSTAREGIIDKENHRNFIGDIWTNNLSYECKYKAQNNISDMFSIFKKFRVYEIGKDYRFKGSKSLNFNVGSNINLSYSLSKGNSTSWSFGWDPLLIIQSLFSKVVGVLNLLGISFKGNYAVITKSENRAGSHGTTIVSQTYLAMQKAAMHLSFDKFERCLQINMNFDYAKDIIYDHVPNDGDLTESFELKESFLNFFEGLFLCSGKVESSKIADGTKDSEDISIENSSQQYNMYLENYYYNTQHFTQGDMLDVADIKNAPWLLPIRGESDYVKFIHALGRRPADIELADPKEEYNKMISTLNNSLFEHLKESNRIMYGEDIFDNNRTKYLDEYDQAMDEDDPNLTNYPWDQLIKVYSNVIPSSPGIYTPPLNCVRPNYPKDINQIQCY